MLKNILNLEGATILKKEEQKSINGGKEYTCSRVKSHEFLYSPEGQAVAEKCIWECSDGIDRAGGCPLTEL